MVALLLVSSSEESIRYQNPKWGFKVDIPRFVCAVSKENQIGIRIGNNPVFSIGCYAGFSIEGVCNNPIQPLKNQEISIPIDEWTSLKGSPIFHGKFKIQGKLSENYFIQGRRCVRPGLYGCHYDLVTV